MTPVNIWAFSNSQHESLTSLGLPFLRPFVEQEIIDGNLDEDEGNDYYDPSNHFDACSFEQSSDNIRGKYVRLISAPFGRDPFIDAFTFGEILHPVQDFYSHSNWVELQTKLDRNHIISGDSDRWTKFWAWGNPPTLKDTDIRFIEYNIPDGLSLGSGITPSITGGSNAKEFGLFTHPRVNHDDYKDDRCPTELFGIWNHDKLNKDDGSPAGYNGDVTRYSDMYKKARELAVFQTNHEFCRYLNLLKSNTQTFDEVSIPLALWLDQDILFSRHSSCSGGVEGSRNVTITVNSIKIKDDLDSGSAELVDPGSEGRGEINLVFVLYTGDFKRSVRTQVGPLEIGSNNFWPREYLPASLSMCINPSVPLVATVQGWDDDPRMLASGAGIFNPRTIGSDADQILNGVTLIASASGSGVESESDDIIVNFDVSRSIVGCPNEDTNGGNSGNSPVMEYDSDNDGIPDSTDNCPAYPNKLQKDSDGDGTGDACDGVDRGPPATENVGPENSLLDSDDDGVLDSKDSCPNLANRDQNDTDGDGFGNACDGLIVGSLIGPLMNYTRNADRID